MNTINTHDPRLLAERLERIEIEVWSDLFHAAAESNPSWTQRKYGTCLATFAPDLDVLAVNKVLGIGTFSLSEEHSLEHIVRAYRDAGIGRFFVQGRVDATDNLARDLRKAGLQPYNRWIKLFMHAQPQETPNCDLRIDVIGVDRAEVFGQTVAGAFEWAESVSAWMAASVGRPHWRHYLAYDGSKPAAAAALYVSADTAWIGFAGTLPEYRGRGAQTALARQRITDAHDLGAKIVTVETGEDRPGYPVPSFRNMRRCGFEIAYARPNWIWRAPAKA